MNRKQKFCPVLWKKLFKGWKRKLHIFQIVNDRQAAALGNLLIFGASLQRICLYDQTTGWTISQLYDCFIPHHQYPIPELILLPKDQH
ncbi:hypothetical protein T4A_5299 [Trichinella pseudospiralis]|uniref:Uncharacterized protein n=1 Tax=Trichinella pseudospiralis TaxID=6337 RepID=A0A0V1E777_TRIPS|nr:hypothetical protein T4A_5299 [Trichinella pseudospiralis]